MQHLSRKVRESAVAFRFDIRPLSFRHAEFSTCCWLIISLLYILLYFVRRVFIHFRWFIHWFLVYIWVSWNRNILLFVSTTSLVFLVMYLRGTHGSPVRYYRARKITSAFAPAPVVPKFLCLIFLGSMFHPQGEARFDARFADIACCILFLFISHVPARLLVRLNPARVRQR